MTPQEIFEQALGYYENGKEEDYKKAYSLFLAAAEAGHIKAQSYVGRMLSWGVGIEQNYCEAVKWMSSAAEGGDAKAQARLGQMYMFGNGVEKNYDDSLKWLRLAVTQNNPTAQWLLGVMYQCGKGVEKDYAEAISLYKLSAQKGHPKAMYALGEFYYDGKGTDQNYEEALKWFKAAAEKGEERAQYELGHMSEFGKGARKDIDKAIHWYIASAKQGYDQAQARLGYLYLYGEGVEKNHDEALKWLRLAVDQNNPYAQYYLGVMYQCGKGVEKDYAEAISLYKFSAQKGNPKAMYALGKFYYDGKGTDQNYEEALKWYKAAAEKGNAGAQYALGQMLHLGQGVKPNIEESLRWYKASAKNGHDEAQYRLGLMFESGWDVPQDIEESLKWYQLSASQGNKNAQFKLGLLYYSEKRDFNESAIWIKLAAEQQQSAAQYHLANMYELGLGVEKNIEEAMFWYLSSANQNNKIAIRRIAQDKYIKGEYEEAYQLFVKAADRDSIVNLAEMHLDGLGCKKSIDAAINLLIKAARANSQQAMYKLAQIYIGEFGTGININEYVRYLGRCNDIRSQLKLAELYFYGIHVERNIYKTVKIWQKIARQGYKCVHYNLALAYYYGIGVDKNANVALEYLNGVKDCDNRASNLLSILTDITSFSHTPLFRMELNPDDIKCGSILEAEWKYINIKSHGIYQEFNRELKEIIEIYKANPSKESYFWLSRLYRELKFENNDAIAELYFKKAIDAGHQYAKFIKGHYNEEKAFSGYDLYLPYNLHDILESFSLRDTKEIYWEGIKVVCEILQKHINNENSSKDFNKILPIFKCNVRNKEQEKLSNELSLFNKDVLQKEFVGYLWDIIAEKWQDTLSFPCETFYNKLNQTLDDSNNIVLDGVPLLNASRYLDRNKNYILWEDPNWNRGEILERSEIREILKIITFITSTSNFYDGYRIDKSDADTKVTIPFLAYEGNFEHGLFLSEVSMIDACNRYSQFAKKKSIILVNQEFCSSTKSKLYNSRVELFDSQYIQTIISLGKDLFKDVPSNTYLMVLNMEGDCNEVTFITDNHKVVVPYSTIAKNEYILNHHIYQDIENQLEDMMVVRLGDLIEIEQTNSIRSNQLANESPVRIISDNEYHGSLLNVLKRRNANGNINGYHETVLRNNTYNGEYIFLKYDNGIKLHIQDNDASSKIRLDIHAFKIKKDSLVSIDYLAYILLSADFQTYMADIVDKNGRFMLSDLLYKKIAINRDKAIQKQIVEDAVIREHQRFGSGVEYNVAVLSENPIVIDTIEQTEGIALLGKDLTFEEVYDKYLTDGDTSILDAIVVDIEHDEYHDVMEVFGDIRELNIHMYIISKEKAVKGKKKVEYFETGNRIFNTDEVIKKCLINKLRDDLDSSNAPQAKIRNKYKTVFEAAEALDKKYPEIGIAKSVMRYIQTGCNIDDVDNVSGPCGSFRQVCHDMLNLMVKKNLVPQIDPGAIPSLIKDGKYYDSNKTKQTYILLESFMPKYLSRSLEYFCKVTNEGVHGSQDSSRLGTAALNILMDFIVWFYEKDICNEDFENIPLDLCYRNVTKELIALKGVVRHVQVEESDNNRIIYAGNILIKENSNKPLQNNSKIKIKSINAYQFGEREEKRRRTKTGEYIEFYCNYDYDIL